MPAWSRFSPGAFSGGRRPARCMKEIVLNRLIKRSQAVN